MSQKDLSQKIYNLCFIEDNFQMMKSSSVAESRKLEIFHCQPLDITVPAKNMILNLNLYLYSIAQNTGSCKKYKSNLKKFASIFQRRVKTRHLISGVPWKTNLHTGHRLTLKTQVMDGWKYRGALPSEAEPNTILESVKVQNDNGKVDVVKSESG